MKKKKKSSIFKASQFLFECFVFISAPRQLPRRQRKAFWRRQTAPWINWVGASLIVDLTTNWYKFIFYLTCVLCPAVLCLDVLCKRFDERWEKWLILFSLSPLQLICNNSNSSGNTAAYIWAMFCHTNRKSIKKGFCPHRSSRAMVLPPITASPRSNNSSYSNANCSNSIISNSRCSSMDLCRIYRRKIWPWRGKIHMVIGHGCHATRFISLYDIIVIMNDTTTLFLL